MDLTVAVLGPLDVRRSGRPVRLGPGLAALLSILLVEKSRHVPADRLVELLWGAEAPNGARTTLRSHLSHLRRALDPDRTAPSIVATVGAGPRLGYRLDLPPERIDAHEFERTYAEGRDAARAEDAIGKISAALALWRGPAFADLADRPFALAESARLDALRRSARRDRAEALHSLGRNAEVVGDLVGAVAEAPYDEGLRRLLVLALYADQRVDEAAEVCREGLTLLARRGLDDPALRELQRRILRREAVAPRSQATLTSVPRMLPPELRRFVGRDAELAEARRQLKEPAVLLITGPAGVGKTTFAIRLAHAERDACPDGQLHVDLRGFDPAAAAMSPSEAVRLFLDALGVPANRVPATETAQVGLYRSLLADRRMLVVLDNARDAEQIRPLLPASPGCRVLVTSRNQLTGLIAGQGAHPLPLGLLSRAEANRMLATRLGRARIDAEPRAVEEIVTACAGLPLACAVVAARAATRPSVPLAGLAADLREAGRGLRPFESGDPGTDVRTVFSWSYRALGQGAQRMFRLLGLHVSAEIGLAAAASLAGEPPARTRRLLDDLVGAHLLTETARNRFRCHDLLRAYAVELNDTAEPAATRRLVEHYLHTASAAELLPAASRENVTPPPAAAGVTVETEPGLDWFAAEHASLLAVVDLAVAAGLDGHAWRLAWATMPFYDLRGHWRDWVTVQSKGIAAAERAGDDAGRAHGHRSLARAYFHLDRMADAETHLHRAMDLYRALGDLIGEANTHRNLCFVHERAERHRAALDHGRQALELYRKAGHELGVARSLNVVGWYLALLGEHADSLDHCERALTLQEKLGHRNSQAATWDSLGFNHHRLGDFARSAHCYRRAVELFQELGDRGGEVDSQGRLGDALADAGDLTAAGTVWAQALATAEELGHVGADTLRAKVERAAGGSRVEDQYLAHDSRLQ